MFGTLTFHLKKGRVWKQASQYHWAFRAPAASGTMHLNLQSSIHRVLQPVWSHNGWEVQLRSMNCLKQGGFADPPSHTSSSCIFLTYRFKQVLDEFRVGWQPPFPWLKHPLPLSPQSRMTPISLSLSFSRKTAALLSPAGICAPVVTSEEQNLATSTSFSLKFSLSKTTANSPFQFKTCYTGWAYC